MRILFKVSWVILLPGSGGIETSPAQLVVGQAWSPI